MAKKRAPRAFEEWIADDQNWQSVLRDAERLGLVESFRGDDGQVLYRVTGRQVSDDEIEEIPFKHGFDS